MSLEEDRNALLAEAYELGFDYERQFGGCGQCVVGAVQDALGIRDDTVFKAAAALSGRGAGVAGTCGAYLGGVIVLGQLLGRERSNFEDPEGTRFRTSELAARLADRFHAEFGGTLCREVQTHVFGRSFNNRDPEEWEQFLAAGAHVDKCPDVVGRASRMAVALYLDEGLIHLP